MISVLFLFLLLSYDVASFPVMQGKQAAMQDTQQELSNAKPMKPPRDAVKNLEDQNRSRERRRLLGLPRSEKLPEEAKIRRVPVYMQDMTTYQRRKERKRLLGLRPGIRVPEEWKETTTEVLYRAEQMRKQFPKLSLDLSIRIAQQQFDDEKKVIATERRHKIANKDTAPPARNPLIVVDRPNSLPARAVTDQSPLTSGPPSVKPLSGSFVYTLLNNEQAGRTGKSALLDLNLPPPDDDM
jgi:hypothetical protein